MRLPSRAGCQGSLRRRERRGAQAGKFLRRVVWHEMGLLVHARCGHGQRNSVGYLLEDNNGVAVTSARVMRECRRVGNLKMHVPRLWNSALALLNTRIDRLKTQSTSLPSMTVSPSSENLTFSCETYHQQNPPLYRDSDQLTSWFMDLPIYFV